MKKTLALILALVAVATCAFGFTSCKSKEEKAAEAAMKQYQQGMSDLAKAFQ